jgi:hypothetical protein
MATRTSFITSLLAGMSSTNYNIRTALATLAGKAFDSVNPVYTLLTDNTTLTEDQSDGIFGIATDAKVITLPSTKAGLLYRIVNMGATTNNIVTISPAAADGISGTFTLAATVVVDAGVVNKDIVNTKATSQCGDNVLLLGTGVAGTKAWIALTSEGIWAVEG